jgi:hypothetical protein
VYIEARWPDAAACIAIPQAAITGAMSNEGFRPMRSARGQAMTAPRKHPACNAETMLADRVAASF